LTHFHAYATFTIRVYITIIIPTYNEAENLPALVSDLFALPITESKILVVDDNSPDGTGQIAEGLQDGYPGRISVLHRSGKLGLGSAYISGFRQALRANAEALCQMDADFSHPPEKIPEMLAALEDCDLVVGSRYVPGGSVDKEWPLWRKGLSAFGSFYARTILHTQIHDMTGGFRLWRRKALLALPLERVRSNGYSFQVEMAYLAHRLGMRCREVPFYFKERSWGKSKMSFQIQAEAAIRVWKLMWEYRDLKSFN
jgi:dolichol-phosphate mannosyltransferase